MLMSTQTTCINVLYQCLAKTILSMGIWLKNIIKWISKDVLYHNTAHTNKYQKITQLSLNGQLK